MYLYTFQILFLKLRFLNKLLRDVEMAVGCAAREAVRSQGGWEQSSSGITLQFGVPLMALAWGVGECSGRLLVTQSCLHRGRWAIVQKETAVSRTNRNRAESYR